MNTRAHVYQNAYKYDVDKEAPVKQTNGVMSCQQQ